MTADELVEALWGEQLPAQPLASLQSQVFRLRRHVGGTDPWLVTDGTGYRLAWAPERVDAARFEELVGRARRPGTEPETAVGLLDDALALWRGRPYLDVADHHAIQAEATRLEELRADAAERRAVRLLGLGRAQDAAAGLETVARDHPFREGPVALRMRALASLGRHAEALREFDAFRRRLADELGLDPSPDLRAVEGEVLRHQGPPRPAVGLPGNSFVGRETDLALVRARLDAGRLVTLTGPGGVGKTRLALHSAARAAHGYPDGVHLCELAGVQEPEAVPAAVASALRVGGRVEQTVSERIVEFLRARQALVVLDNCEHVLDGAVALVRALLVHTTAVDVLATSRLRLGVEGEHVDGPTAVVFADRAAAVQPGFMVSGDNAADVKPALPAPRRCSPRHPRAALASAFRPQSSPPPAASTSRGRRTERRAGG